MRKCHVLNLEHDYTYLFLETYEIKGISAHHVTNYYIKQRYLLSNFMFTSLQIPIMQQQQQENSHPTPTIFVTDEFGFLCDHVGVGRPAYRRKPSRPSRPSQPSLYVQRQRSSKAVCKCPPLPPRRISVHVKIHIEYVDVLDGLDLKEVLILAL